MVQPYDYSMNVTPLDPLGGFFRGVQAGDALQAREMERQRAAIEVAEMRRKQEQQVMLRTAMTELAQARTPAEKIAVFDKYPALAEPLQKSASSLDQAVRGTLGQAGLNAFAMLEAGDMPAAVRIMQETAAGLRNSNRPELAAEIDVLAQSAEKAPDFFRNGLSAWLAVNARDQFEGFGKAQEARGKGEAAVTGAAAAAEQRPLETRAKAAAATTAEAKAAVAAPLAALELEKAGWDIKALQNDMQIKRQNAQIAAINAQIAREGNSLKAQELQLKVAELNDKVGTRIQERAAEGKQAQAQANILLDSADKALRAAAVIDPKTGKITGFTSTVRSATGPIESRLPTLSQDVADFEAMIETLGSQVTMSRIGEMKGVLSDKDMEVLRSSMANLSLKQSPAALVSNLQRIVQLTQKAQNVTAERYGLPAATPPDSAPARRRYNPATGRIE